MTLSQQIQARVLQAFSSAFPALPFKQQDIEIMPTKEIHLGHYQCNSAMRFSKVLGQSPRHIAEAVLPFLEKEPCFDRITIAGPGFINLVLAPSFLEKSLRFMLSHSNFGLKASHPEKIIVDFSSPNVAKEMHVGHLRSTIIGDSLARIFEFLGHSVLRLNHIGDWGTAFGMLICEMEEVAADVLSGQKQADLSDLMAWYRASKQRFDEDPLFKKAAQLKVVALQSGEPSALEAWRLICTISETAYQRIYDLLDVKINARGESFYNPYLESTCQDLASKGLVTQSDGAACIFVEGFKGKEGQPLPLIIQKSDGGFGYASTDMAAIWHRRQVEKAERIIYVTDAGQGTHFAMIFATALKAGYLDHAHQAQHVPFGLVLGGDGKKFKTRSGETEKLIDLLTTAVEEARALLIARGVPEVDQNEMAFVLGINALKYADLSCNRVQDYQFSYEKMLRFEGNTAAFIMYSLVRILSIQRKIGPAAYSIQQENLSLLHPSEIALGLHLARFSEMLDYVAQALYPHRLTDYLYELAHAFNAFFRDCRVEGDPQQASRLVLCELSARVFKTGMTLLGLRILEKM